MTPSSCRTGSLRLHSLSKNLAESARPLAARVEQTDRVLPRRRREMHVAHRRRQIGMAGKLLDGLRRRPAHRQMRAERVAKNVDPAGRAKASPLLSRLEESA